MTESLPNQNTAAGHLRRTADVPLLLFLCLLWAFFAWLYYPGIVNGDTIAAFGAARALEFGDWRSITFPILWRILQNLTGDLGPGPILLLFQFIYFLAIYVFINSLSIRIITKYLIASVFLFYPPLFNLLGMATVDLAFVSLCFLFYATIIWCMRRTHSSGSVLIPLTLAFLSVSFRRDSILAIAPGVFLITAKWLSARASSGRLIPGNRLPTPAENLEVRKIRRPVMALVFSCAALLGLYEANTLIVYDLAHAGRQYPTQMVMLYDLSGISVLSDDLIMPQYVKNKGIDINVLRDRFSSMWFDPLIWNPVPPNVPLTNDPAEVKDVLTTWASAIKRHPWSYVEHRWNFALHLIGINPPSPPWFFYMAETDHNLGILEKSLAQSEYSPKRVMLTYIPVLNWLVTNSFVYRGWLYILLVTVLFFLQIRKWASSGWNLNTTSPIIVCICLSTLMHLAVFLIFASASDFRYLYWLILGSLMAAFIQFCPVIRTNTQRVSGHV